jgi:hypothetical protein
MSVPRWMWMQSRKSRPTPSTLNFPKSSEELDFEKVPARARHCAVGGKRSARFEVRDRNPMESADDLGRRSWRLTAQSSFVRLARRAAGGDPLLNLWLTMPMRGHRACTHECADRRVPVI